MKTPLTLLSFALLLASARAQTPPCDAMNDVSTSVSSAIYSLNSASPNYNAWQYIPSANLTAQAIQLFTGNNYFKQSLALEIWSDVAGLPATRLAGGFWKITQTPAKEWQGTNLDKAVSLAQGTKYWIVLIDPGWTVVPIEPGGTTMLPTARQSGGVWVAGSGPQALKCRIFCNLLDQKNVAVKGKACSWSGGLGTLFVNQAPTIGNVEFKLEGSGYPVGTSTFAILGANPSWPSIPIPGGDPLCFLHTDILVSLNTTSGTGNVRDPAAATGQVVFALPIPAQPSLAGGVLSVQLAAAWSGSSYPVQAVSSNGLLLTLY